MFLFLDESGDLGFDLDKPATSRFFTVTILICSDKKHAQNIRIAVERTLKNKLNHKKSKRRHKELKGANTKLEIKKYFLKQLSNCEFSIYSITLNKSRVNENLKTKLGKKKLYNFLARFILEKTNMNDATGNINLVLDKCKNKSEIKDFNNYIESQLQAMLPLETNLHITHESSSSNYCLQAVDLFCWGIARKYSSYDKSWYDLFEQKVSYDEVYLP